MGQGDLLHLTLHNSHKKRKGGLETRAKPVVLWAYVEKQVMLEPRTVYGPTF